MRYGTADDIALILPLYDYWKFVPQPGPYYALTTMREKFDYDLNGPIVKK